MLGLNISTTSELTQGCDTPCHDYEVVSNSLETISVYKKVLYLARFTAFLPLLECVLKLFFSKHVKHLLLFRLDLCNGVKTVTFELDSQLIAASP